MWRKSRAVQLLPLLGVDHRDAGEVDDVFDLVAALEDVDRLVHADEHRPDRLGAAEAIGPMLVGMDKPVHVLQRGDEVKDIVNLGGVAVVDAQKQE